MEHETGRTPTSRPTRPLPSAEERKVLMSARVSAIIDAHGYALDTLIRHGFTLLAQPQMRWAMAHTVNLGQAFRLRGLDASDQERLLAALTELGVAARLVSAKREED